MSHPPLTGLKILDFSTLIPGPYATMLLGDLGADVLRIEAPGRPDLVDEHHPEVSGTLNRNKRRMTLNLKVPESLSIVKKLIQDYDILLEQFRPGVMKSLGLDYATLSKENPHLIYCSLTGYGQTGPYANRAGHDINYMALSAMNSCSGSKEAGPPVLGMQVADISSGSLFSVIGILSAVIHRNQTGQGQHLDISMMEGVSAKGILPLTEWLAKGKKPGYETMLLNGGTFYNHYRTKDGRYLSIGSLEPKFFQQLAQAMEFDVSENPGTLIAVLRQKVASKTLEEWKAVFSQLDACVEPVLDTEEWEQHPHVQARHMVIELKKPDGTLTKQLAHPIKFSQTPPAYRHYGPQPGADTEAILQELGYSQAEVQRLRHQGIPG